MKFQILINLKSLKKLNLYQLMPQNQKIKIYLYLQISKTIREKKLNPMKLEKGQKKQRVYILVYFDSSLKNFPAFWETQSFSQLVF